MLREYEFTFVAKGDLPDEEKNNVLGGYEEILKREGGEILEKKDWGVKKMAYPIKKQFKGHYFYYDLASLPENIAECERLLRIDDKILRYLVVKTSDKVDVESRKVELLKKSASQQQQQSAE